MAFDKTGTDRPHSLKHVRMGPFAPPTAGICKHLEAFHPSDIINSRMNCTVFHLSIDLDCEVERLGPDDSTQS